jgi:hypothetical protein
MNNKWKLVKATADARQSFVDQLLLTITNEWPPHQLDRMAENAAEKSAWKLR